MRRFLWPVVASLAFIAVVFLFVLPTRTYLGQHNAIDQASSQISTLKQENQALEHQAADLQNPSELSRIARLDYGMVKPGQPATVVLPSTGSSNPASSSGKTGAKQAGRHHAAAGTGTTTTSSPTSTTAP
jgi:cell division protein FtsB